MERAYGLAKAFNTSQLPRDAAVISFRERKRRRAPVNTRPAALPAGTFTRPQEVEEVRNVSAAEARTTRPDEECDGCEQMGEESLGATCVLKSWAASALAYAALGTSMSRLRYLLLPRVDSLQPHKAVGRTGVILTTSTLATALKHHQLQELLPGRGTDGGDLVMHGEILVDTGRPSPGGAACPQTEPLCKTGNQSTSSQAGKQGTDRHQRVFSSCLSAVRFRQRHLISRDENSRRTRSSSPHLRSSEAGTCGKNVQTR
ncbi:unnamed protein product [Pleuronectes platessa]|uniref:Uncharacterized protein n=1 Tax=Pleuronectes platessa TaxID=8262 RepID=A0A9N7VDZ9_PLEPL|nr:unnamed protein product [Pleuronectes platessa]